MTQFFQALCRRQGIFIFLLLGTVLFLPLRTLSEADADNAIFGASTQLAASEFATDPRVAVAGNRVHVVWNDQVAGSGAVLYRRSLNGGETWLPSLDAPALILSGGAASVLSPLIVAFDDVVIVTWTDAAGALYARRSDDGGMTWGDIKVIAQGVNGEGILLTHEGQYVYLVFQGVGAGVGDDIFFMRSANGGGAWSQPVNVSLSSADSRSPSFAATGPYAHLAWVEGEGADAHIAFLGSSDYGVSFSPVADISESFDGTANPQLATNEAGVSLLWQTPDPFNEVRYYFRHSPDAGAKWTPMLNASPLDIFGDEPVRDVVLGGDASRTVLVGRHDGIGMFFRQSLDGGGSWMPPFDQSPRRVIAQGPVWPARMVVDGERIGIVSGYGMMEEVFNEAYPYFIGSTDGGATFGPAQNFTGMSVMPHFDVAMGTERVYAAFAELSPSCGASCDHIGIFFTRAAFPQMETVEDFSLRLDSQEGSVRQGESVSAGLSVDAFSAISNGVLTAALGSSLIPDAAYNNVTQWPFTQVELTAVGGDAVIDALTVERRGSAFDSDFTEIMLLNDQWQQIGAGASLNDAHQAVLGEDIVVRDGETKTVLLAASMAGSLGDERVTGKRGSLALVDLSLKGSAQFGGTLPIEGESQMLINQEGAVIIYRGALDPPPSFRSVGEQDYIFSSVRVIVGSMEDANIEGFRFTNPFTAQDGDVRNLELVVGSTVIASLDQTTNGVAAFDLSARPVRVSRAHNKEIFLRGDIASGAGRVASFDIAEKGDIRIRGLTTGHVLEPTYPNETAPYFDGYSVSIVSGSLVVKKGLLPAPNVTAPANQQTIGAFVLKTSTEPVAVSRMAFQLATTSASDARGTMRNIAVYDEDGVKVAGPVDPAAFPDAKYRATTTDTFIVPVGEHTYAVKADLDDAFALGDTVQVVMIMPPVSIVAEGVLSHTEITAVPSVSISSDPVTIGAGSVARVGTSSSLLARNTETIVRLAAFEDSPLVGAGAIQLSVSGLPMGAVVQFSPQDSCAADCTASMDITASLHTPPGTYEIAVMGALNGLERTVTYTLTVLPALNQGPSVVINDDDQFTRSHRAHLTLRYPETVTKMRISPRRLSAGSRLPFWQDVKPEAEWFLAGMGGEQTVYVQYQEENGTVLPTVSDTIILDLWPPTGRLRITDPEGTHPNVVLNLAASDRGSGVTEMMVSNTHDFAGAAWQPYQGSLPWTMDGSSVYAKFRDAAGNVSMATFDLFIPRR